MSDLAKIPLAGPAKPGAQGDNHGPTTRAEKTLSDCDIQPVIDLLDKQPEIYSLLSEAVPPIEKAFGSLRRRQHSEGSRAAAADFGHDPEVALESFDRDWWLDNCHRSDGALIFDYEIHDAV
jgi:hypothetical protein